MLRSAVRAMSSATSRVFGRLPDGRAVEAFTLSNARGMTVDVTTYGATVLSVRVPSARGPAEEVTLCHTDLASLRAASPYFGATIGRVANRTAKGAYKVDGRAFTGAVNNGPNHLHGGLVGFDKVLWEPRVYATAGAAGVEFSYTSKDGEEGCEGAAAAARAGARPAVAPTRRALTRTPPSRRADPPPLPSRSSQRPRHARRKGRLPPHGGQ